MVFWASHGLMRRPSTQLMTSRPFFNDKVASVRASTAATPLYEVPYRTTPLPSEWTAVTADEIDKLIGSAPNKTCQLDPVPTWLVKDVRGLVSPFISLLFNKSTTI